MAAASLLFFVSMESAMAMQRCPSQDERLKSAEIVVDARVRSLTIGDSGLTFSEGMNARMIRAELEVVKAIKGDLKKKDIVAYASPLGLDMFQPLVTMASAYGFAPNDSLHVELSVQKFAEPDVSLHVLMGCGYWKLPEEFASVATGNEN
ncbi:hypothetical protein HW571_21165 [Agrobacterium genomosp. 3]|nr:MULTISPECIES: hypothetical protein [Rhizobium/Agrobacterium group]MBP8939020.1 hypothetical protein [Agrobacterium sp.]MCA1868191.1 hypothetical protein [Agrobacterium tomkonis]MCA2378965.1 hypothetical protein [Agrobacterium tomkonis RTP8]KRA63609.1 hypothetical protein ASD85_09425 [Rhizobium sp. Root651]MCA1878542.1 hypothetical protein [Agrobacterium tumefaciens]